MGNDERLIRFIYIIFIPMTREEMLDKMKELVLEIKAKWERLEAENKSLKEVIERLHKEIEEQDKEYCKLKKENQTLELWLDNKEKLNEEYRKQIDKLKEKYGDLDY